MSSFMPTVYAIDNSDMKAVEQAAQSFMNDNGGGTTLITSARNKGHQEGLHNFLRVKERKQARSCFLERLKNPLHPDQIK